MYMYVCVCVYVYIQFFRFFKPPQARTACLCYFTNAVFFTKALLLFYCRTCFRFLKTPQARTASTFRRSWRVLRRAQTTSRQCFSLFFEVFLGSVSLYHKYFQTEL